MHGPTGAGHTFPRARRDKRTAAKLKAMGLQPGWPDLLLLAPAAADRPGGLVHMLELKRRGEDLTKSQEDLAAWCAEQGVPFACTIMSAGLARAVKKERV
jgi:hypothetical protein